MAYTGPFPINVADGGTGDTSLTAYAVLCGGATSTGAIQSIASVGSSGNVLTSNGAGALPTFQAPAFVGSSTYFAATKSSNSTNATGNGTPFHYVCDTVLTNVGSNYNNSTGAFTAPATGFYGFCATVFIENLGAGHTNSNFHIAIDTNLFTQAFNPLAISDGSGNVGFIITAVGALTSGQTAFPSIAVNNSTQTVTIFGDGSVLTSFSGWRIA